MGTGNLGSICFTRLQSIIQILNNIIVFACWFFIGLNFTHVLKLAMLAHVCRILFKF